jgi:sarcosine oxidase subunit beta
VVEGFLVAAGYGGDGITLAPVTGKLIAEIVVKGRAPVCIDEMSLARFDRDRNNA